MRFFIVYGYNSLMGYKDFLKTLHEQSWFRPFIDEVIADAPVVPPFNPAEDNTARWRYDSAMREGYRLCLLKFGVNMHD